MLCMPTPDPTVSKNNHLFHYVHPCPLQPIDCRMHDLCGVCNGDDRSADVVTGSPAQHGTIGKYTYTYLVVTKYLAMQLDILYI